jgi:hypothetical protein
MKRRNWQILVIAGLAATAAVTLVTVAYISVSDEPCASYGDRVAGVTTLKTGPAGTYLHYDAKCESGYRWVKRPR